MHENFEKLDEYLKMIWRHHWLAVSVALIVCIIGWSYVIVTPNRYQVKAKVYLDQSSMLKPLLKGLAAESQVTQRTAQLMEQTLLSTSSLEQVVKKTGLAANAKSDAEVQLIIKTLAEKITIYGNREGDNVYLIVYEHSNPRIAHGVVDELLKIFIEQVLHADESDKEVTEAFLDKQIAEYEAKLEAAEQRLKDFKQKHFNVMASDGTTYFARLESLRGELTTAKLELQEAITRKHSISMQVGAFSGSAADGSDAVQIATPLDTRIQALEAQLDELQSHYTERHPDVISTHRILQELRMQKQREAVSSAGAVDRSALARNPVYQQLGVLLSDADGKVASLQTRVKEYERRLAELQKSVDTVPKVEAELTKLNRDYDVNKERYELLLQRRESAKLAGDAEKADEVKFEIIDAPKVPMVPVGPNRLKWVTIMFVFGVIAGVGVALLLSQMKPVIYNKKKLRELTDFPIFGTLSPVESSQASLRRSSEMVGFGCAAVLLIGMYVSLMAMYQLRVEFLDKLAGMNIIEVFSSTKSNVS